MTVHVELFGIPRQRAGLKSIDVPAQTLGEMLRLLQQRLPQLAEGCFENGHLKSGFLANRPTIPHTDDPLVIFYPQRLRNLNGGN